MSDADDTVHVADHGPDGTGGHARRRSIAAGITGVVAVLGVFAGLLGFWTLRTATDSGRFESRIDDLLQTEEVSDALARRVVAETADALAIRQAVADVTPDSAEPLVELLLAGARSRIELRLGEVIRTPDVAGRVAAAAGRAHALAVDVLEGDDLVDGVDLADGEVRVNLLPLTVRTIGVMQEVGLFRGVELPQFDLAGDPDVQRSELAAALDRELPADFGTPVVFRSDSLEQAGSNVDLVRGLLLTAKRTFWLLLIVGVAFAAASIWWSQRRWRAAAVLVAGLFAMTLVTRWVMRSVRSRLPDVVEQPGAKATVRELTEGLERSLNNTLLTYSIVALLALLLSAFAVYGVPAWRAVPAERADSASTDAATS